MFKRVRACYIDTERCPKGMKLLNQYASLRDIPAQHALRDLLLQELPPMVARLRRKVKGKS